MDLAAENVEAGLDAMKLSTVKLNSSGHELANAIKLMIPDAIDSRPKVFYYITRAKVDPKTLRPPVDKFGKQYYDKNLNAIRPDQLTANELKAAKAIEDIFKKFSTLFAKKDLKLLSSFRSNYLPLWWEHYNPALQPFKFTQDFDKAIAGISPTFQFGKHSAFGNINRGLQKGYKIKPEFEDPVELIKVYVNAAGKALATRALIGNLELSLIHI